MLKIKDNVDLKELEKYGLKPKYDENTGEIKGYSCEKYEHFYRRFLKINKKKKNILFRKYKEMYIIDEDYFIKNSWGNKDDTCDFDLLYDLIKADLVEKVGDDNE